MDQDLKHGTFIIIASKEDGSPNENITSSRHSIRMEEVTNI
jgi:hypothetical protein